MTEPKKVWGDPDSSEARKQRNENRRKRRELRMRWLVKIQVKLGMLLAVSILLWPPTWDLSVRGDADGVWGGVYVDRYLFWGNTFFGRNLGDSLDLIDWGWIAYGLVLYALFSTILVWVLTRVFWREVWIRIWLGDRSKH